MRKKWNITWILGFCSIYKVTNIVVLDGLYNYGLGHLK